MSLSTFMRRAATIAASIVLAASSVGAQLSAADRTFVNQAVMANNYEISAADLATSHSINAAVKAFAQMMADDHTNLAAGVKAAVNKADSRVELPGGVTGADQANLDALRNAGRGFDSTYKAQMVAGHTVVQMLFQNYVNSADANPGLKAVISGALPTVQKHLDAARALPDR